MIKIHGEKISTCECDACGIEFERRTKSLRQFHFCSKSCRNVGQATVLRENRKKIFLERYGVDNPMKNTDIVKSVREGFLERYGVDNPMKVPELKERKDKALRRAYDERGHQIETKRRQTCQKRYGVDNIAQLTDTHKKARKTRLERYGVEHHFQLDEFKQQRVQTMQKNFRGVSRPERQLHTILKNLYGEVKRQVWINSHPVDFYVPSIDTYIELDGDFYHGLTEKSHQYEFTQKNFERDRQQDTWFIEQGLRLIRIRTSELDSIDIEARIGHNRTTPPTTADS